MKPVRLAASVFALSVASALAQQQPAYQDNRSDAAELVRSLYNAINRREYARAWDYFGDRKPAKNLQAFADGYAQTERVEIETGDISEEGAAGSVFYSVPVAIKAIGTDGNERVFAGCYMARFVDPQIQDATFKPMHIESGTLQPTQGGLAEVLPPSCGSGPAPQKDALVEEAKKRFSTDYSGVCQTLEQSAEAGNAEPATETITFRSRTDAETDPERHVRLFSFQCGSGAYNTRQVYYLADDTGAFRHLHFATPELDIRYENDDIEGKVESINIVGYTAANQLVNSQYSTDTRSIDSHDKWRGAGDASSIGRWIFRDGNFTLVKYEVDATYDGEVSHETVLDFDTPP